MQARTCYRHRTHAYTFQRNLQVWLNPYACKFSYFIFITSAYINSCCKIFCLLVGDEAAIPAIAAALERLAPEARADVYLEVANETEQLPLRQTPNTKVTWVHRDSDGSDYGVSLARTVREAGLPEGRVHAFVHGNAYLVRDLRRFLFVEQRLDRSQASISGYWRTEYTEDKWQSTKGEFVAEMDAAEQAALVV